MPNYRLSRAAEEDLIRIVQYGYEHFGIAQSDRYRDQIKRRFSSLVEQPVRYPAVPHIHAGYRRSVCGVTDKVVTRIAKRLSVVKFSAPNLERLQIRI